MSGNAWEGYLLKAVVYKKRFACCQEPFPHDPERYGDILLRKAEAWSGVSRAAVIVTVPHGESSYCFLIFIEIPNPTRSGLLEISKHLSSELFRDESWSSHVMGQGHLDDWKEVGKSWDSRVVKRGCGVTIDWPTLSTARVPYTYDAFFQRDADPKDRERLAITMEALISENRFGTSAHRIA
jgi:hypothetical protein